MAIVPFGNVKTIHALCGEHEFSSMVGLPWAVCSVDEDRLTTPLLLSDQVFSKAPKMRFWLSGGALSPWVAPPLPPVDRLKKFQAISRSTEIPWRLYVGHYIVNHTGKLTFPRDG